MNYITIIKCVRCGNITHCEITNIFGYLQGEYHDSLCGVCIMNNIKNLIKEFKADNE